MSWSAQHLSPSATACKQAYVHEAWEQLGGLSRMLLALLHQLPPPTQLVFWLPASYWLLRLSIAIMEYRLG